MLLLLPPSEGKADPPPRQAPVDLPALAHHAALGPVREQVLDALDPGLRRAPAAPARELYTGVLFTRLELAKLTPAARRRAEEQVLIASGLWGLLRPDDRVPRYKLPIGEKLAGLPSGLGALWRPALAAALAGHDDDLVVDARSGGYASLWKPKGGGHVAIRAFRVAPDGTRTVISHNAKATRGDVVRALLSSRRTIRTARDVAEAAAAAGHEVELTPTRLGSNLDVLER